MPRGSREYEQLIVEGINGALSGQGQGVVQRVLQRSNTDYATYLGQVSLGGIFHSTAEKERRKAIRAVIFLRLATGEAFHTAKAYGERINSNSTRIDLIRDEIRRLVQTLTPTPTVTRTVTPTVTPTVVTPVVRHIDTTSDLATGRMTAPSELVYENVGDTVTPFSKDHVYTVAERLRTLLTGFEAIELMRGLDTVRTNVELSMISAEKAHKGFNDTLQEREEQKKGRVKLIMSLVGAAIGAAAGPAGGLVANVVGTLGAVAAEAMTGLARAAAEAAIRTLTENGADIGKAIAEKAVEKLTEKACRAQEIQVTGSVQDTKIALLLQYDDFRREVQDTILDAAYEIIGGRDTTFRQGRIGESEVALGSLDNRTTPIKRKAMEYLWHVHGRTSFHGSALVRETVAYIQTIQDAMSRKLAEKFGLRDIPTFNRSAVDRVGTMIEWVLWANYYIPDPTSFARTGTAAHTLSDADIIKARLVTVGLIGLTSRTSSEQALRDTFYYEGRLRIHGTRTTTHQQNRLYALFRTIQKHIRPIDAALGKDGATVEGMMQKVCHAAQTLQNLAIESGTEIERLEVVRDIGSALPMYGPAAYRVG